MSFAKLLTDRVDIYKLKKETTPSSYGVPGQDKFYYSDEPDFENVPCNVQVSSKSAKLYTQNPGQVVNESFKVVFQKCTDISVNDKVVFNGVTFRASVPRYIKNHHIEVEIMRDETTLWLM